MRETTSGNPCRLPAYRQPSEAPQDLPYPAPSRSPYHKLAVSPRSSRGRRPPAWRRDTPVLSHVLALPRRVARSTRQQASPPSRRGHPARLPVCRPLGLQYRPPPRPAVPARSACRRAADERHAQAGSGAAIRLLTALNFTVSAAREGEPTAERATCPIRDASPSDKPVRHPPCPRSPAFPTRSASVRFRKRQWMPTGSEQGYRTSVMIPRRSGAVFETRSSSLPRRRGVSYGTHHDGGGNGATPRR